MNNLTEAASPLLDLLLPQGDLATETVVFGIFVTIVSVAATSLYFRKRAPPMALKRDEFQAFTLEKKEVLSHDTRKFTFALPSPYHQLGLPVGQHITLKFTDEHGKSHQRSYTPVSGNDTLGSVSFVIKVYKAGVHPKFPAGGKLSQHLDSLKVGDTMLMKGPKGHLHYLKRGKFTLKQMRKPLETRQASHINMVCGGTGITPMLQVLHAIFKDPYDKTTVSMIYANQTEQDILVRDELEALAREYPSRFSLHYTVDKAGEGWKYSVGFVDQTMMEKHLKPWSTTTQVFICGPPPMVKFACLPALQELGFTEKEWFVF